MPKCRDCALAARRPGCTAGGGDDFNTYIDLDDDSKCPSFQPRETPLLVDELAKAVRRLLVPRFAFDPQWAIEVELGKAVMSRYQKEVGDA